MRRFIWVIIILLVVIMAAGGVAWSRYRPGQAVEISLPQGEAWQGEVYIGGQVSNPGIYPMGEGDSVAEIIRAAGGFTDKADAGRLELHVPGVAEGEEPQKIDINRAEAWLLEALPGIGEARAQAIVDYRRQHGPFRSTSELLKVEGMGGAVYEKIKDLITVGN